MVVIAGKSVPNAHGVEISVSQVLHNALAAGTTIEEIEEGLEKARREFISYCNEQACFED